MEDLNLIELKRRALEVRRQILDMTTREGCFIGASNSCADLFVYLYSRFLNVSPENLDDPGRDYLFLSKGHAVPALYATLSQVGILAPERLKEHCTDQDHIYLHPHPDVPGIEHYSGSLGHSLAVAVGVAFDCMKLRQGNNRVVVVTGDGELNEGSIWEALLLAASLKLDNLIVLVDRNVLQANMPTEELIPLEPLSDKFEAFGCRTQRIDGHDFKAMEDAFSNLPQSPGKPSVIIADTIRGKGIPGIEGRVDKWFVIFSKDEAKKFEEELLAGAGEVTV